VFCGRAPGGTIAASPRSSLFEDVLQETFITASLVWGNAMRRVVSILLAVVVLGWLVPAATLAASVPGAAAAAWHWGSFFGDDVSSDRDLTLSPAKLSIPDPRPIAQVGSSNSTQYTLLADGTVWAWGQGTHGELGNGGTANSFTRPVRVRFPAGVAIAFLATDAMPYDTALAVDTSGNAWGWGYNHFGQLCRGTRQQYDTPVRVPLTSVTTLAGAAGHAVYDAGGTVYSCGSDWNGVLGDGGGPNSTTPVRVSRLNGAHVLELVSAFNNAGALLAGGTYWDWGYNAAGQLGDGSTTASDVPVQVPLPGPVAQAAQGGSAADNGQTIVMLTTGTLYAWGSDSHGQLGDRGTARQLSPEHISPPPGVSYATVASGGATSYAIATNGAVWAWGDGTQGQLGDGKRADSFTPIDVMPGTSLISTTAADVVVAG
jgi:alpha-tubulin suppressor-like RCC1 family protein